MRHKKLHICSAVLIFFWQRLHSFTVIFTQKKFTGTYSHFPYLHFQRPCHDYISNI